MRKMSLVPALALPALGAAFVYSRRRKEKKAYPVLIAAENCGSGLGFDYCVYAPPEDTVLDPSAQLYFLHGAGGHAKLWGQLNLARKFYEYFRERDLPAPAVVAVSFGSYWLLTENNGTVGSFISKVIPHIEEVIGAPDRRILWGISMGAFNALQVLFRDPSLWNAAMMSCPAIAKLPPNPDSKDWRAYVSRTGAWWTRVEWMAHFLKKELPTPESWARHDPIAMALRLGSASLTTGRSGQAFPPMYISCGDKDEYGFFEGAKELGRVLNAAGHPVEFWRIPNGKHCAIDTESLMNFLMKTLFNFELKS